MVTKQMYISYQMFDNETTLNQMSYFGLNSPIQIGLIGRGNVILSIRFHYYN